MIFQRLAFATGRLSPTARAPGVPDELTSIRVLCFWLTPGRGFHAGQEKGGDLSLEGSLGGICLSLRPSEVFSRPPWVFIKFLASGHYLSSTEGHAQQVSLSEGCRPRSSAKMLRDSLIFGSAFLAHCSPPGLRLHPSHAPLPLHTVVPAPGRSSSSREPSSNITFPGILF